VFALSFVLFLLSLFPVFFCLTRKDSSVAHRERRKREKEKEEKEKERW